MYEFITHTLELIEALREFTKVHIKSTLLRIFNKQ